MFPLRFVFFPLLAAAAPTPPAPVTMVSGSATQFINTVEEEWYKHKSPDIQEGYPFGRSNAANNAALEKVLDLATVSKDSFIRNKHFLAEGDWYAVEWFYGATSVKTGRKQIESSLCFAEITGGKMTWWIEYFDDTVGELQMEGKLPLYKETEEPYPWPTGGEVKRVYRP